MFVIGSQQSYHSISHVNSTVFHMGVQYLPKYNYFLCELHQWMDTSAICMLIKRAKISIVFQLFLHVDSTKLMENFLFFLNRSS